MIKEQPTFQQQLADPRWQQMRLKILERDGFACVICDSKDKTLHVHHKYYEKNTLLWEYPAQSLETLCHECHKEADKLRVELKRVSGSLSFYLSERLFGYAKAISKKFEFSDDRIQLNNAEQLEGAQDAYGMAYGDYELIESRRDLHAAMNAEILDRSGRQVDVWSEFKTHNFSSNTLWLIAEVAWKIRNNLPPFGPEDSRSKTMARYRKIDVRLWGDGKFNELSKSAPCGQVMWLYLLSGPHTSQIPGVFQAGEAGMAEALGWSLKAFREAFAEAFAKGMVKADWKARFVWIPKAINYNIPESPNVVKSWQNTWDEMPECELKVQAYEQLKAFLEGYGEAFGKAFVKACRKPLPNQEQEQEQEQEQDNNISAIPIPPVPHEEFQKAWNELGEPYSKISKWNEDRKDKLRVRWKDEFFRANWLIGISRLMTAEFAKGGGNTGWIMDVNFFLRNGSLEKILEGKYDNGSCKQSIQSASLSRVHAPAGKYKALADRAEQVVPERVDESTRIIAGSDGTSIPF